MFGSDQVVYRTVIRVVRVVQVGGRWRWRRYWNVFRFVKKIVMTPESDVNKCTVNSDKQFHVRSIQQSHVTQNMASSIDWIEAVHRHLTAGTSVEVENFKSDSCRREQDIFDRTQADVIDFCAHWQDGSVAELIYSLAEQPRLVFGLVGFHPTSCESLRYRLEKTIYTFSGEPLAYPEVRDDIILYGFVIESVK